jgi:hypothetical protein
MDTNKILAITIVDEHNQVYGLAGRSGPLIRRILVYTPQSPRVYVI